MTESLASRYTLFFDFLGTSAIAELSPPERVNEFIGLLISISQIESVEHLSGCPRDDGGYGYTITPEVTTFSDHVVVSYKGATADDGYPALFESVWTEMILLDCIRILRAVAEGALRIGVLVRGGLSFGPLYHKAGVVFGEGMVSAHYLETKASMAKIAVSDRVVKKLTHDRPESLRSLLLRDPDPACPAVAWHLNYFRHMIENAMPPAAGQMDLAEAHARRDAAESWRKGCVENIDQNIAQFATEQDIKKKWTWFKAVFESETARFAETDIRSFERVFFSPTLPPAP